MAAVADGPQHPSLQLSFDGGTPLVYVSAYQPLYHHPRCVTLAATSLRTRRTHLSRLLRLQHIHTLAPPFCVTRVMGRMFLEPILCLLVLLRLLRLSGIGSLHSFSSAMVTRSPTPTWFALLLDWRSLHGLVVLVEGSARTIHRDTYVRVELGVLYTQRVVCYFRHLFTFHLHIPIATREKATCMRVFIETHVWHVSHAHVLPCAYRRLHRPWRCSEPPVTSMGSYSRHRATHLLV